MNIKNTENPWQEKIYRIKPIKKAIDLIIPKEGTKEHRILKNTMKDAASKDKMEWIYVNRVVIFITTFVASVIIIAALHRTEVKFIYTDPTSTYNIIR